MSVASKSCLNADVYILAGIGGIVGIAVTLEHSTSVYLLLTSSVKRKLEEK